MDIAIDQQVEVDYARPPGNGWLASKLKFNAFEPGQKALRSGGRLNLDHSIDEIGLLEDALWRRSVE